MAKLADIIAAAHERNFTDEQYNKEYSAACWQILDFVAKNITGFQADK